MNVSVSDAANHLGAMEAADYGFQAMTYSKHRWWPEGRKKWKKIGKNEKKKKKMCTECRIFSQVSCLMRNIASPMTKQFSKDQLHFCFFDCHHLFFNQNRSIFAKCNCHTVQASECFIVEYTCACNWHNLLYVIYVIHNRGLSTAVSSNHSLGLISII